MNITKHGRCSLPEVLMTNHSQNKVEEPIMTRVLEAWSPARIMTHKPTCCGTILIIHLIVLLAVPCHPQQSPCPDIFSYRVDRTTGQVFGFVEIRNIQVGQTAKLNVNLFIAAQLPPVRGLSYTFSLSTQKRAILSIVFAFKRIKRFKCISAKQKLCGNPPGYNKFPFFSN